MTEPSERALEVLLAADPVPGGTDEPAWRALVEHAAEMLDVGPGTSVFDVGCGAGAFLFPLWQNGYLVGGLDPSTALIGLARKAMPDGLFGVGSPLDLDPAEAWDVVVASRGLPAFAGRDDARAWLARMVAKATHGVAVLHAAEGASRGPGLARSDVLRMLAEIGVSAVQFEAAPGGRFHVYARVRGR